MTKAVWKYPLGIEHNHTIMMPVDAKILKCENQHNVPCIWALVDTDEVLMECRKFILRGTGHPIHHEHINFISTFQVDGGNYIFHLFEVIESHG